MDTELDKELNRDGNFVFSRIDSRHYVRLLRISRQNPCNSILYNLETVAVKELHQTRYKALSYIWGHAHSASEIREIRIDNQAFHIRQNLFDFMAAAATRGESGLFFIDAICINQLDLEERQFQVQLMSRIYRCASEVIAWLGVPEADQLDNVEALSHARSHELAGWTARQWAGYRYLSHHRYWRRTWIVQEVLLASSITIWCGPFSPPLAIFSRGTREIPMPDTGGPLKAPSHLSSPAEILVTHRSRLVYRPCRDLLDQGTKVGTMEDMMTDLRSRNMTIETYQSRVPDVLYEIFLAFPVLECSDPRDRLYGLMGLLNDRSRAMIKPDYEKDLRYAFYQALKVGLEEIYHALGAAAFSKRDDGKQDAYLGYYSHIRDAFGMTEEDGMSVLRQVFSDLNLQSRLLDDMFNMQLQDQLPWRITEVNIFSGLKELGLDVEQDHKEESGRLLTFHQAQHRLFKRL
jgi:hypothetical protein